MKERAGSRLGGRSHTMGLSDLDCKEPKEDILATKNETFLNNISSAI